MIRGQKDRVDSCINDLQAINLPYASPNEQGLRHTVQLGVHPIQLYELVFPKEHFELILNTISPNFNNTGEGQYGGNQSIMNKLEKLRFLLKAQKIPKMDLRGKTRFIIRNAAVSMYPFAVREDSVWTDAPTEVLDNGQPIPKELIGHERL